MCKIRSAVEKQSGLDVTSQSIYTMNELIRIVCICFILHELDVDYIIASPLNVHTPIDTSLQYQMPIPIQKSVEGGIERKRGEVNHPSRFVAVLNQFFSEICPSVNILQVGLWTAPGAACLAHFVNEFRFQPMMQIKSIGRGLKSNNWVGGSLQRLFIGELDHLSSVNEIYKIECNIDDMTGEEMGFVIEQLLRLVSATYMVPVYMKKIARYTVDVYRDGCGLAPAIQCIFKHTSTLGVRYLPWQRANLMYKINKQDTDGSVRIKTSYGAGITKSSYSMRI